ncbi:MAG: spore coat protein CotJB [Bacillota bacterium]
MSNYNLSLLRQIMELEFTSIELNLFLDTHPDDQDALRDINRVNEKLVNLIAEYERQYGPLLPFLPQNKQTYWRWIEEPWPWEITY